MDKIGHSILEGIPASALSLNLARSTIKMRHSSSWRVDKSNEVHDLVVCLRGSGLYHLDEQEVRLERGMAMLIPAGSRFVGRLDSGDEYTGIAQHFTLTLFDNVDLIQQMILKPVTLLDDWDSLEVMVRYYREVAPVSTTTLQQHHLFMVILLAYLDSAFVRWREDSLQNLGGQDALSLHVILIAAQISRDPLNGEEVDRLIASVPYNDDYFRRAFKTKIGYTPKKYLEFKRMEKAMNILSKGKSVKETALKVGYSDVYFFSRMFKLYMGASPSQYRASGDKQANLKSRSGHVYHE